MKARGEVRGEAKGEAKGTLKGQLLLCQQLYQQGLLSEDKYKSMTESLNQQLRALQRSKPGND
ncbi:hypothetical protein [Candidatus Venteria ishoeyi]|uniref:hypothetical protein n=1 Tax=Candidatus Venteria ishoeyi TaxID=1899563 RepID=UPI000AF5A8DB|nr:hypothetical protein [Candidatus Venteria ishoeyi]